MAQKIRLNNYLPNNVGTCSISPQLGIWTLVSATGVTDFYLAVNGPVSSVRHTYTPNYTFYSSNEVWLDLKDLTAPISVFNWRFNDLCNGGCGTTYDVTITSVNDISTVTTTGLTTAYGRAVLDNTTGNSYLSTNGIYDKVRGFLLCEGNVLKLGYYLNVMTTGGVLIEEGLKKYTLPTQPSWSTTITGIPNTGIINELIFGAQVPISPSIDINTTSQVDIAIQLKSRFKTGLNTLYPQAWREIDDLINGMTFSCTKSGTTSISITAKPHMIAESSPGYNYPTIDNNDTATIGVIGNFNYNAAITVTNNSFTVNPTAIATAVSTCGSNLIVDPSSFTFTVINSSISDLSGYYCIHTKDYTTVNLGNFFQINNSNTGASTNSCTTQPTATFFHNRGVANDLTNFKITNITNNNTVVYNGNSNSSAITYSPPSTFKIETTTNNGCSLVKTINI